MVNINTLRIYDMLVLGPARAADHHAPKGGVNAINEAQHRSCKPEKMSGWFKYHSQPQRFLPACAQMHLRLYPF